MKKEITFVDDHTNGLFDVLRKSRVLPILSNIVYKNSSLLEDTGDRDPKYPFGIENDKFNKAWHSQYDEENAWLEVYFPSFYFQLKSYSLKGLASNLFQSWDLTAYSPHNNQEIILSSPLNVEQEFDDQGFIHCDIENYMSYG